MSQSPGVRRGREQEGTYPEAVPRARGGGRPRLEPRVGELSCPSGWAGVWPRREGLLLHNAARLVALSPLL